MMVLRHAKHSFGWQPKQQKQQQAEKAACLDAEALVVLRVVRVNGHVLVSQALLPVIPHQAVQEADLIPAPQAQILLCPTQQTNRPRDQSSQAHSPCEALQKSGSVLAPTVCIG